ncbi:MAG: retron St85 family effector protein [Clostridia bacterium]|nr:retron St85 family effector protein [Clostridia bacterium]
MELLKDKGVLTLIDELKKEIRTRGFEDKALPRFIFICGEQILDNSGKLINEEILEANNNVRYFIMKNFNKYTYTGEYGKESHPAQCVISEYLYSTDKTIDILTFEEVLAEISEYIIIITESPGTFCELGAFALHDSFVDKIIVINEDNPKFKSSFISLGPIKKIENQNEKNVILYSNKSLLKSSLEFNDMIREIATKEVKFTPNLDSQALNLKNLIYELLNLTELFEPITPYELEFLYKRIREITNYTITNKDKHKIFSFKRVINLMVDMKVISYENGYCRVNKNVTCTNTMFTMNRKKINDFRTKYLCRVYKIEPERMESFI